MWTRFPSILYIFVFWFAAEAGAAEPEKQVDLRLVVDVSEVMAQRDPDNLRRFALEYLIRSLPDDAMAGVWSYARHTQKVAAYGKSDPLWKQIASIHAGSLKTTGAQADLPGALQAASWDLAQTSRGSAHIVLFSNGDIRLKDNVEDARQQLLSTWAGQLRRARIHVHTVGFANEPGAGDDLDLLRQLAEVSGGVNYTVADRTQMQTALLDIQNRIQSQPQADLDSAGRFQVAPGAERLNILWFVDPTLADKAESKPSLTLPDGSSLDRLSPLKKGRWLLAQQFEIVTLHNPQAGWWRVQGPDPESVTVFGELDIRIDGLDGTVVPGGRVSAAVALYSQGQRISHKEFLRLLDVRAWLIGDEKRKPLPVDPTADGFVAHFVNLQDGAQTLEIKVVAPTFTRSVKVPFVVSNPLFVEVRQEQGQQAVAWLQFNHPQVNYATVRATGIVRKPPQIASLIPAERMPAGLWRIPLDQSEGVVQASFSVAGNYLDGEGVFLKTEPHALTLPLAPQETLSLRYGADGKYIALPEPAVDESMDEIVIVAESKQGVGGVNADTIPLPASQLDVDISPAIEPPKALPLIPLWFVAVISLLNLLVGGVIWWLNKPKPLPFEPIEPIAA